MRKKRLIYNTMSSLIFQIVTIVCGFVLPRLILGTYGSEANGLVNSITQFLSIIAFLELGVGAVVQSSLYKPLVEHDDDQISKIILSANKFFRKLAYILVAYVVFLMFIYPLIITSDFSFAYISLLILTISISTFAQYYFGIVNRLLLVADQRGYIQYNAQTLAVVMNTFFCFLMIKTGSSIQVVKLVTSTIYVLQPFAIYLYVNRHYRINKKITCTEEPIKQKWNGIAQHVAAIVLDHTDTIVLTTFATLSDVSIYSVYFLVVKGVKQLFLSLTSGITSLIGELWARRDIDELEKLFSWVEWVLHTATIWVFGITSIMIVPFVSVYTSGITDANYIQPLFGILIVAANAGHCLRLPYNIMILAAGHYKQTQNNYIIAAAVNVIVSVAAVRKWGLIGVAIGTLIAMLYQTVWMAIYNSKNLIKWPFRSFLKQFIIDNLTFVVAYVMCSFILKMPNNYTEWIVEAVKASFLYTVILVIINIVFYNSKMVQTFGKIIHR